jgi:hypothetical protein
MIFEEPIRVKKVKNNVYAYQYRNGVVNIEGVKYVMHSMTSAINTYRKTNKIKL